MKLTRTVHLNPVLITFVPLVTVVFLLLAFFSLNSSFAPQPGISVNLPTSSFALRPERPEIVSITADPVPTVYFESTKCSMEEFSLRLASTKDKRRTLVIKADKNTPYEAVMRAINEALLCGYPVVLATVQPSNAAR